MPGPNQQVLVRESLIVWIRWTKFRDDIIKSKIQEIMQREFHKVMQLVTYVDTLLNVTVNFYLFWPRNEIQTYNDPHEYSELVIFGQIHVFFINT